MMHATVLWSVEMYLPGGGLAVSIVAGAQGGKGDALLGGAVGAAAGSHPCRFADWVEILAWAVKCCQPGPLAPNKGGPSMSKLLQG